MVAISSRYCRRCGKQTAAIWSGANHILHLILTIFTAGIWLPMWILFAMTGSWRCQTCGSSAGMGSLARITGGLAVAGVALFAAVLWFGRHAPGPINAPEPQRAAAETTTTETQREPAPTSGPVRMAAKPIAKPAVIAEAKPVEAPSPSPAEMAEVSKKKHEVALRQARTLIKAGVIPAAEKKLRQIIAEAPGTPTAEEAQKELDALPAH